MSSNEDSNKNAMDTSGPNQNLGIGANRAALLTKLMKFQESLKDLKTISFLKATSQLCHMDISLAQHLWIQLFPRLWKILSDKQQNVSVIIEIINLL